MTAAGDGKDCVSVLDDFNKWDGAVKLHRLLLRRRVAAALCVCFLFSAVNDHCVRCAHAGLVCESALAAIEQKTKELGATTLCGTSIAVVVVFGVCIGAGVVAFFLLLRSRMMPSSAAALSVWCGNDATITVVGSSTGVSRISVLFTCCSSKSSIGSHIDYHHDTKSLTIYFALNNNCAGSQVRISSVTVLCRFIQKVEIVLL